MSGEIYRLSEICSFPFLPSFPFFFPSLPLEIHLKSSQRVLDEPCKLSQWVWGGAPTKFNNFGAFQPFSLTYYGNNFDDLSRESADQKLGTEVWLMLLAAVDTVGTGTELSLLAGSAIIGAGSIILLLEIETSDVTMAGRLRLETETGSRRWRK